MRTKILGLCIAALYLVGGTLPSSGASLHVDPVLLEVTSPAAAAVLTLRNKGISEINAQVRVFRWVQSDGVEKLEQATDVVASPPMVTLAPNNDYVVRIVRLSKQQVSGEEAYRLLIDELPKAVRSSGRSVNLLVRHSIPVFFAPSNVGKASIQWSASIKNGKLMLTAQNLGDRRLRVAALRVHDSRGNVVSFGDGLVGYVLGKSSITWTAPVNVRGFGDQGTMSIAAESDLGPIRAVVDVRKQ